MNEQRQSKDPTPPPTTKRQAWNIFADTVTGPNIRTKDNLYQALAIAVCLVLGAGVGFLTATDKLGGILAGGITGCVAGLIGSGIFLMIYRLVMHSRGRHD